MMEVRMRLIWQGTFDHVGDGISQGSHASMLKEAFIRAYSPMVHPMTSEDLWPKCHRPLLLPPLYHKQPRRPRKKRMRLVGEPPQTFNPKATKLQRYNLETSKCSVCRYGGHNMRSYLKAKEVPSKPRVKKNNCHHINQEGYKTIKRQVTCWKLANVLKLAKLLKLANVLKLPKLLKLPMLLKLSNILKLCKNLNQLQAHHSILALVQTKKEVQVSYKEE
ncbi:unnamed protein product [Prunus armeniaca]